MDVREAMMVEAQGTTLVDTVAGAAELGARLGSARRVAASVETNEMHAYRAVLCLVSLNVDGALFVLDPLALVGKFRAMEPIALALGQRAGLMVHGGEYLVAGLKRDLGVVFGVGQSRGGGIAAGGNVGSVPPAGGVADSQQAASLLGWERTGYRALVSRLLGHDLPYPLSTNWSRRPLDAENIAAASQDVRWLPAIHDAVSAAIAAAELEDEYRIACADVAYTHAEIGRFDPQRYRRLKGASRLSPTGLTVLKALYLWRDSKARELDLPPGKIIANPNLVSLAQAPEHAASLVEGARFHSHLLHGDRVALGGVIRRALSPSGPVDAGLSARRESPPPSREGLDRLEGRERRERQVRLKRWRRREAEDRGIGLSGVLTRKSLDYLAAHGAADLDAVPGLGPARAARYGAILAELCARS